MISWDDCGDEDMITCPDCGHKSYPEVGMGFHNCPGMAARLEEDNKRFEKDFFGARKLVRTVVVVEHYDTDSCFTSALDSIHSRLPHQEADTMLGWQYVVLREE